MFEGADVEELRAFATTFDAQSKAMGDVAGDVDRDLAALEWQGADWVAFTHDWRTAHAPALRALAAALTAYAAVVRRNADEQERASAVSPWSGSWGVEGPRAWFEHTFGLTHGSFDAGAQLARIAGTLRYDNGTVLAVGTAALALAAKADGSYKLGWSGFDSKLGVRLGVLFDGEANVRDQAHPWVNGGIKGEATLGAVGEAEVHAGWDRVEVKGEGFGRKFDIGYDFRTGKVTDVVVPNGTPWLSGDVHATYDWAPLKKAAEDAVHDIGTLGGLFGGK